jgi:uncharacterized secreted protein with C-terminal beta-propeller domain
MKKILLTTLLLFSTSMADTALLVKKGWQLIGSAIPLNDMSKFKSTNVEQVWHFDATTQKWLGYSPDRETQNRMSANNISKLKRLENWHGFWVKSRKEWTLTLPNDSLSQAPSDENSSNDIIHLEKGWNLISLPIDTVLSADIFKDMTVWKYNPNQEWEIFDREENPKENFPKLAHIKNSDGLWVKADKDTDISVMKEASKLHNFSTSKEMKAYIKSTIEIYQRPICGFEPIVLRREGVINDAVPTPIPVAAPSVMDVASNESFSTNDADSGAKNTSGTNLQELDVDEADIVKHDGINIFYTQRDNSYSNKPSHVNIISFSQLAKGQNSPLNQITFNEKGQYIDSLYLVDKKLVVLSNLNSYARDEIKNVEGEEILGQATQHIVVDIFDVSDIMNIKKISSYKIDGNKVTSRVVDGKLYLVSNFSPRFTIEYPKEYVTLSDNCKEFFTPREGEDEPDQPYPEDLSVAPLSKSQPYEPNKYTECYSLQKEYDSERYYRYDYENPILKVIDLVPDIEGSDLARQELIKPSRLYTSSKQNQNSNMTTISTIDISDGTYKLSNSFMGYSSTQYASSNALYLVSNQYPIYYDFYNYKERSSIYKFNLGETLDYRGIGSVYGHMLNQFSLSEYKEILRVATTEGFSWGMSGTNNSIYTLKEESGLLPIQGVLSGLGKENEIIKSVRFMGDKGYVVTFKQTDPLYTIDMSDPKAPKKMGELKVNGYSAYLHPVGEDKLLGIGRDADSKGGVHGVKIELFDISDFQNPSSLDTVILKKDTYSELENNHKALAYRNSDNLFAFPYREQGDHTNDYKTVNYLGVYQIKEDALISYNRINSATQDWGESRGLIFDMNNRTFISFFSNGKVTTEKLEER